MEFRHSKLGANNVYQTMLKENKTQLKEAVGGSNSIHAEVEAIMNDFASNLKQEINVASYEEQLRNAEKDELTQIDKKVIAQIRKILVALGKPIEDFEKFKKNLNFEYVVSRKGGPSPKGKEEEIASDSELPKEMEPEVDTDDDGNPIRESKEYSFSNILDSLLEAKKTKEDLKNRVEKAIEEEEDFIFDVASESGQIVGNVKNMSWFKNECANWLIQNVKMWSHLK